MIRMLISRGIARIYAIIILVSLTILAGIALYGLLLNSMGGVLLYRDDIYIYPNATISRDNTSWYLRMSILNKGSLPVEIASITVEGLGCMTREIRISHGELASISCSIDRVIMPGKLYSVKIITKKGFIYIFSAYSEA